MQLNSSQGPGRRFLAIWLPFLTADRWAAAGAPRAEASPPVPAGRPVPLGLPDRGRSAATTKNPAVTTAAHVAGSPILPLKPRTLDFDRRGLVEPAATAKRTPPATASGTPLVFVEKVRGAQRLAALSPGAVAAGLAVGMDLASARAQLPALDVVDHDPLADLRWLERIADVCERFTPLFALDPPDAILLDITGVAHLWGGEVVLAAAVEAMFESLHVRLGTANTPEGAAALARFAAPGQTSLGPLPIAALRLDEAIETALRRAGLNNIRDLASRPTAPLAARFGAGIVYALDRLLGRADSRLNPRRQPPALIVERRFAEPIATTDIALAVLDELLAEAAAELDRRGRGGRRFTARFYRSDNAIFDLGVETGLPSRDTKALARLFHERIDALSDPIDPGFGFDMIRLAVPVLEPLAPAQLALEGGDTSEDQLAALVDRLSTRLGRNRVHRLASRDTHIPEQAAFAFPAADPQAVVWAKPEAGEPPLRPIHLFDPPQPVAVTAGMPEGPPRQFQWRRTNHVIVRHEGPERIAGEWWRLDRKPGATRDYYRVEDARGRRFWLFRHGLPVKGANDPRWYLHGLFA